MFATHLLVHIFTAAVLLVLETVVLIIQIFILVCWKLTTQLPFC